MKRHGHLFERAFSRDNLLAAFQDAARHKRAKRACFQFERRLAFHLDRLHAALHDGSYRPQPYYSFMVYEPKARRIYAPSFADLVVQHAIYRVVYPIFNPGFIDQSFACRVGKGTHAAADYAQAALQASPPGSYTLKLDIRKFFYSIDRAALREQIEKKIKDRRFVALMMLFADHGEPVGIPIGNLLSQLYALIVLNPLDHFIKRELKVQRYCRYVDDFILFGLSRERCQALLARIVGFLGERLRLVLSRFTLAPLRRGLNFVGYRTWASRRFIRKHSLFTFRRRLKSGRFESLASIIGHARRTHSLNHLITTLKDTCHDYPYRLPEVHQYRDHPRAAPA